MKKLRIAHDPYKLDYWTRNVDSFGLSLCIYRHLSTWFVIPNVKLKMVKNRFETFTKRVELARFYCLYSALVSVIRWTIFGRRNTICGVEVFVWVEKFGRHALVVLSLFALKSFWSRSQQNCVLQRWICLFPVNIKTFHRLLFQNSVLGWILDVKFDFRSLSGGSLQHSFLLKQQ